MTRREREPHREIADDLAADAPQLDVFRRARIERDLLQALRARVEASPRIEIAARLDGDRATDSMTSGIMDTPLASAGGGSATRISGVRALDAARSGKLDAWGAAEDLGTMRDVADARSIRRVAENPRAEVDTGAPSASALTGSALLRVRRRDRRGGSWFALGIAASVMLGIGAVAWERVQPRREAVAHFTIRGSGNASGAVHVGGTLEVAAGDRANVRVGNAELDVRSDASLHFVAIAANDLALRLERGSLDVAFHPARRGEESLVVDTKAVRVEVVGTVFSVVADATSTRVSVSEGAVRVVPRATDGSPGQSAVMVRAGESVVFDLSEPMADVAESAVVAEFAAPEEVANGIDVDLRLSADALAEAADLVGAANEPNEDSATELPGAGRESTADRGSTAGRESTARAAPQSATRARARRTHGTHSTAVASSVGLPPPSDPMADATSPVRADSERATPAVEPRGGPLESARVLLMESRYAEALEQLEQLSQSSADVEVRIEALSLIGDIFGYHRGQPARAVQAYRAAIALADRPIAESEAAQEALYSLARLYERRLRDSERARAEYRRYLEAGGSAHSLAAQRAVCRLGGLELECASHDLGSVH